MSYYITAHRHGAKINVPVEEKHKYITDTLDADFSGADVVGVAQELNTSVIFGANSLYVGKTNFEGAIAQTSSPDTPRYTSISRSGIVKGLNLGYSQIELFYRPAQLTIEKGTGPRQRIGDKVFLKSVQIILNITASQNWMTEFSPHKKDENATISTYRPTVYTNNSTGGVITTTTNTTTLYNSIDWRKNIRQWMKFRILIVRFNDLTDVQQVDETSLKSYIQDWFNTIFVPAAIVPNGTFNDNVPYYKDINVVSNQSKMLRESTNYNGKYKIIYDDLIELAQNNPNKHIEIKLDPKMNLTFNDNDQVTDEKFNDTYGFIIPPTFYKMDMDTCTYQAIETSLSSTLTAATFMTNIKFTYYDI